MTFEASRYPAERYRIRYVDPPRDATPLPRRGASRQRVAIVAVAAATLLVAAIGFALAGRAAPARVTEDGPVPVQPVVQWAPSLIPVAGSAQDEPNVQWRPSLIPVQGGVSLALPKPGDIILTPEPPGRVPAA